MPPPCAVGSGCLSPLLTTPELLGVAVCGLTGLHSVPTLGRGCAVSLAGRVMLPAGFCSCLWIFPWLVIALSAGRAWQDYGCKMELPSSKRQLWRGHWGDAGLEEVGWPSSPPSSPAAAAGIGDWQL